MDKELYYNIVFKKFKKHFKETTEQEINDYFHLKEKESIYCEYCKTELKVGMPYPYYNSPSIDHKKPKTSEGKNEFDNIAICCFQCNIVKGTMNSETYEKMLELLSKEPEWKNKILNEIFTGRFANKLARLKKEENIKLTEGEKGRRGLYEFV